jgi:tetratricopeptide (TPR) repeat protein
VWWCDEQASFWNDTLNPVRRRQMAEALIAERSAEDSAVLLEEVETRLMQVGLAWFEAERQTLVRMFDWAAETQQEAVLVALAANLVIFFQLRSYWGEWVSTHIQALAAARQIGDTRGEGQTLNNLGMVYNSQGKWEEAIAAYEQSLQTFRAIDDVHGEGQSLANLGIVYKQQKQLEQAKVTWREALTKLHPDSPEHATVTQWLQAPRSRPTWQTWLLPAALLLFLLWNLLNGHGLIALGIALFLLAWLWHRRR